MLLKSLELQGFKSFADKTVLDFSSDITAIVGPNGSGKSNVTDAIRWLLGERDARNLRGGKAEDLIFAGTDKKPRLGMAQATLTFDNSSKFFPVDFNEVSISRKVTRDGDSFYYLNKAEVRLKDLIDFFAKAKLGARGLTIITQGSSDLFIRSTPMERKEMIEEILGLKEYQIKKTDSIRKLKNANINLETVNASLQELKPHLKFLKRQVSRYEERDGMAGELKMLEDALYGRKFKFLKSDLINYRSQLERIGKIVTEEEKLLKDLEAKLTEVKQSEPDNSETFKKFEKAKAELQIKRANLERELGKLEARVEFEMEKETAKSVDALEALKELKILAEEVKKETDISKLKIKIDEMLVKIDEVFNPQSGGKKLKKELSPELKASEDRLMAEIKILDEDLKKVGAEEDKTRGELSGFNKLFTESYERAENQRKKLNDAISDKNRLQFEIEKIDLKISNLKEEIMQTGRTLESIDSAGTTDLPQGLSDDDAMRRMFKLRGDLAGIGEIDQNLVKEAKETEERFNYLTQQVADLETAIKDLRVLIKDLEAKIHQDFAEAIKTINEEFIKLIRLMFGGGTAKLVIKSVETKNPILEEEDEEAPKNKKDQVLPEEEVEEREAAQGIEVELTLPKKRIKGLDVLSGGERTLVSVAVLFSLISVSPPPFLVLDEVDAALDEANARRCSEILKEFSKKSQFIVVTHNRATMEVANVLYGVTMQDDGTSRLLSLKLEDASKTAA